MNKAVAGHVEAKPSSSELRPKTADVRTAAHPLPAAENLRTSQTQLDMDGCHVGVSRQALEEVLAELDRLHAENFALAANQCKAGYADEHGDHMCSLLDALREAERFLDYFAHNRTTFVGPGTPTSALAHVRWAIAKATDSDATRTSGAAKRRRHFP